MLDLIESRAQAYFIAAVVAKATGGELDVVTPLEQRDRFITWLYSDMTEQDEDDPETAILKEALGLNRR